MHDCNGTPLAKGDVVLVPMLVTDVQPGADHCNVSLESILGRKPDGAKEHLTGNTAVVVKTNHHAVKSIIHALGLILLAIVLTACAGAQTGYIRVEAIDDAVQRVSDRHDAYVAADPALTPANKATLLRTTQLLRDVIAEAKAPATTARRGAADPVPAAPLRIAEAPASPAPPGP